MNRYAIDRSASSSPLTAQKRERERRMPRKDKNQRLGTASLPKLEGKNELDKLKCLSSMKYEHQAKWFLNVSQHPFARYAFALHTTTTVKSRILTHTHNNHYSGLLGKETTLVLHGRQGEGDTFPVLQVLLQVGSGRKQGMRPPPAESTYVPREANRSSYVDRTQSQDEEAGFRS